MVTSPSGPSASPWVSVSSVPGRAEVGQPDPAVDVLAEVDDVPTRAARVTATGDLLDPAHRRRRRATNVE